MTLPHFPVPPSARIPGGVATASTRQALSTSNGFTPFRSDKACRPNPQRQTLPVAVTAYDGSQTFGTLGYTKRYPLPPFSQLHSSIASLRTSSVCFTRHCTVRRGRKLLCHHRLRMNAKRDERKVGKVSRVL